MTNGLSHISRKLLKLPREYAKKALQNIKKNYYQTCNEEVCELCLKFLATLHNDTKIFFLEY